MKRQQRNRNETDDRQSYHVWVIRRPVKVTHDGMTAFNTFNGWQYLKEGSSDKRCLHNVDRRRYSRIEIRESGTGKATVSIVTEAPPNYS